MKLGPEWPAEYYILSVEDYIYAMMLEVEEMYVIGPSKTAAFVYVMGRGMVMLVYDFRQMSEQEIQIFIHNVRQSL